MNACTRACLAVVGLGWLGLAAPAARAHEDPRVDPGTGRERLTRPHARPFDHRHLRLELDVPDMAVPRLAGRETLTLAARGSSRSEVSLDCRGPVVSKVMLGEVELAFSQADGRLSITLPAPAQPDVAFSLTIDYTLDFGANKGEGLTWSKPIPTAASLTRQSAQIHAQGQAELNSRWFPCHDFPNDKLTSEVIITVEDGYDALSNGRLVGEEEVAGGRRRWHWLQDKPHSTYLITLLVGKFAEVEVGGESSARPGLSMPVYVPWGKEEYAPEIFGRTPEMVAYFEQQFDEPYPWDRYAQACVRDFAAGGMENTSLTLLAEGTSNKGLAGSRDDLISHELAHQWFGDLVTYSSWEHLWLGEGWASYAECLWDGQRALERGAAASRDAYLKAVLGYVRQQRLRNRGSYPENVPMASARYDNPDHVFSKPDDPYGKGAVVLHMLRERLGDDAFWRGVRAFIDAHKFGNAESDDFRRALEAASGKSLDQFFAQWVYRAGLPRLAGELDWDDARKTLRVRLEQTQKIDALNPAFEFRLPLAARGDDGAVSQIWLDVSGRDAEAEFTLPAKPAHVSIDPDLTVLASVEIRKPLAMWTDEVARGVTVAARISAAEALAECRDPRAWEALAVAAEADADEDVRREAARCLEAARRTVARLSLIEPAPSGATQGASR